MELCIYFTGHFQLLFTVLDLNDKLHCECTELLSKFVLISTLIFYLAGNVGTSQVGRWYVYIGMKLATDLYKVSSKPVRPFPNL